jgi:hypothetical protein
MDTRDMFNEGSEMLELTDAELEGACGGSHSHFSPFTNNFNNSNFSTAPVTQYAYANSSFGNVSFPSLNSIGSNGILSFGGGAQATNYYNYSVGYLPGQ